jgi:hypothetical protein
MSWTKRQFVEHAFEEAGYAAYTFDLQPEQLEAGLRRLDAMMAMWHSKGISLGYPLPDSPSGSNLDDLTNVPDRAVEAICANLAVRVGPLIGKMVPAETRSVARAAYTEMLGWATTPSEVQIPGSMPAGAGHKTWQVGRPFLRPTDDGIITPPEDTVEFLP